MAVNEMREERRKWETHWKETLRVYGDDPERLLQLSLEALREFPHDWQFLYRAAVDELRLAEGETDVQRKTEFLDAAIGHARLSVEIDPEKHSAQWVLQKACALRETKK